MFVVSPPKIERKIFGSDRVLISAGQPVMSYGQRLPGEMISAVRPIRASRVAINIILAASITIRQFVTTSTVNPAFPVPAPPRQVVNTYFILILFYCGLTLPDSALSTLSEKDETHDIAVTSLSR